MTARPSRDPGARLACAIVAHAAAAGCRLQPLSIAERDWTSATFSGVRHRILFAAAAEPALASWLAALPDADFEIPGHVVADVVAQLDGGLGHRASSTADRRLTMTTLLLDQA